MPDFNLYDYLVCYRKDGPRIQWDCYGNFASFIEADVYHRESDVRKSSDYHQSTLISVPKFLPEWLRHNSIRESLSSKPLFNVHECQK